MLGMCWLWVNNQSIKGYKPVIEMNVDKQDMWREVG